MEQVDEIAKLAKEIIDDAELKRGSVESLVNKTARLASLTNDETIKEWLAFEKYGYSDSFPSLKYMEKTGRTYDKTTKMGYWGSISMQETSIENTKEELEVVKNFKPSGLYSAVQFNNQVQQVKALTARIAIHRRICAIVVSSIQDFATRVYYANIFGQKADNLLEKYRKTTLVGILKYFPRLNSSFEIINKASSSNNPREWALATSECRSILINLSGQLWKSEKGKYICRDGQEILVQNDKNKLIGYIDTKMGTSNEGKARAKKLFGIIHEVFTLGGKSKRDIDEKELSTAIIDTYVFLNDIISYTDIKPITSANI